MNYFNLKGLWRYLLSLLVVFLTACGTNTFTVQQEIFQQLDGTALSGSYAIRDDRGQSLERRTYANLLQQQIHKTGLYQASSADNANYLVDFDYTQEARQRLVQDYHYDPIYVPYWSYFPGPNGRVYSTLMYQTTFHQYETTRQVNYNYYTLRVLISQRKDGQNLFQSTVTASSQAPMVEVMPYLMAAVFDGYPGQNAQIREVVFDLDEPDGGLAPAVPASGSIQSQIATGETSQTNLP